MAAQIPSAYQQFPSSVTNAEGCEDPLQYQSLAEEREILNKHYLMTWSMEPHILTTGYGSRWLSVPVCWRNQRSYWVTKLARSTYSPTRSPDSCSDSDSASLPSVGSDDVPASNAPSPAPLSVSLQLWHSADALDFFPRCEPGSPRTELCPDMDGTGQRKKGSRRPHVHGQRELRQRVRPTSNKNLCKKFHRDGFCSYGRRCKYVH